MIAMILLHYRQPGCLTNIRIKGDCGKINQEVQPMCANADKTIHLKTLIAEIKALYAQWGKARKNKTPVKTTIKTPTWIS